MLWCLCAVRQLAAPPMRSRLPLAACPRAHSCSPAHRLCPALRALCRSSCHALAWKEPLAWQPAADAVRGVCALLRRAPEGLNTPDRDGFVLLHRLAAAGQTRCLQLLLVAAAASGGDGSAKGASGLDLLLRTRGGATALQLAKQQRHDGCVQLLEAATQAAAEARQAALLTELEEMEAEEAAKKGKKKKVGASWRSPASRRAPYRLRCVCFTVRRACCNTSCCVLAPVAPTHAPPLPPAASLLRPAAHALLRFVGSVATMQRHHSTVFFPSLPHALQAVSRSISFTANQADERAQKLDGSHDADEEMLHAGSTAKAEAVAAAQRQLEERLAAQVRVLAHPQQQGLVLRSSLVLSAHPCQPVVLACPHLPPLAR